ncbi:MAG TPA: prephenate dehydratase [Nevskiaceae bacterium]|nr:prephenate dehydratase [Nevskiaceae bacterium]
MADLTLPEARAQIDALDEQIQRLISSRARIAQEVARIKQRAGDGGDHYRPSREAEVLRRAIERNQGPDGGPLTDDAIARLMREIMSACLSLESPLTVAYLGPEGTYTQAAVLKHFGDAVTARPVAAIDEIFREVESGAADYGVVPVENSTGGIVSHTLDELVHTKLRICGEVMLPVHHHLLSRETAMSAVTSVYAHPQSFAQCRKWLTTRLPKAEREAVSSNGEAARIAAEKGGAAIAGLPAARLYGLNILASNIEDDPGNTTRFLVIGKHDPTATGADLTSIVATAHRNLPGALFKLLQPFAEGGIDMTRIESRSVRGSPVPDYYFFIDVGGHATDAKIRTVLDGVRANAAFFKVLGSYPRAVM